MLVVEVDRWALLGRGGGAIGRRGSTAPDPRALVPQGLRLKVFAAFPFPRRRSRRGTITLRPRQAFASGWPCRLGGQAWARGPLGPLDPPLLEEVEPPLVAGGNQVCGVPSRSKGAPRPFAVNLAPLAFLLSDDVL